MKRNLIHHYGIFLALLCCSCSGVMTKSPGFDDKQMYSVLSAKSWNWEHKGCSENRRRFYFQGDKMVIKFDKPVKRQYLGDFVNETEYKVLGSSKNIIRAKVVDEYRKDINGKPVEWDLILENDSTFRWRRSDMPTTSVSRPLVACD